MAVLAIALTVVLALGQVVSSGSTLNRTRHDGGSARAGVEHCFAEQGAESRLPFIRWVRTQIPSSARYELAYAGRPDLLCVRLVLLPALPVRPGRRADWTIAFGIVPPTMQARIARHDPSVRVFAPGLALEDSPPR